MLKFNVHTISYTCVISKNTHKKIPEHIKYFLLLIFYCGTSTSKLKDPFTPIPRGQKDDGIVPGQVRINPDQT